MLKKIIKIQTKGMVTIPIEFREKLGIEPNSLLEAKIVDNGVFFAKVEYNAPKVNLYSDEEIKEWMIADKIDEKTAKKLAKILK
ncbi:hypothetical protein A2483_05790 [Candidatus Peregrinibacteria bacterium RIFOXYC2_FULL_33_13]|nr:MAG: hypothetical protein UR27_C0022G0018 [Candidatus Peregrinibacteria bacterium GW2011_GWA2_33_10]KKP38716.1 MAG: hypothetical protein UR30_C0016G0030 [Candidatus Peregrinibacteria bacterium GW2011_GWC2_33_13]OGJ48796.1 MAG: hypothetical protein A2229_03125 [Candidatus Peregrinibacteria bacterium RIFOXYA2_FULL_33_7]OGJ52347.1 MAG: hypothetical protein A2483_05790 [Candidatus Peregrinibacteria bacterium RIFOXYC2_FULL_33_13]